MHHPDDTPGTRWQDLLPPPGEIICLKGTAPREAAELFWNHHTERLLPVMGAKGPELWVSDQAGLWREPDDTRIHWSVDAGLAKFMPEHTHHEVTTARKEVARYAFALKKVVGHSDLDADMRCLAAPNGVIDLTDGILLTGEEARARLMTSRRMVADPFDPDADEDPDAEEMLNRLFAFTDAETVDWLMASMGFALHGDPAKRVHVLTGPTGAGKSTIVQAAVHALGGYGAKGRPSSINRYGRPSGFEDAGVWFAPIRVAVFDELDGVTLDAAKLKDYSSGGVGTKEVKFSQPDHDAHITATAFLACNDDQVRSMGAEQQAMSDRLFLVRMGAIPVEQQDRAVPNMFQHHPATRRGMLAVLVRCAAQNHKPPLAPVSTVVERQRRVEEDLGIEGAWLQEHVLLEGDDLLTLDDVMRAMRASDDGAVSESAMKLSHQRLGNMLTRYVAGWDALPRGRTSKARGKLGARLSDTAAMPLKRRSDTWQQAMEPWNRD